MSIHFFFLTASRNCWYTCLNRVADYIWECCFLYNSLLISCIFSPAFSEQFSEEMNISTEDPHQVDFLVPFKNAVPVEGASANVISCLLCLAHFCWCRYEGLTLHGCTKECSLEGVAGLIRFIGSVSALAYLGPKESISEAISDLKVVKISICTVLFLFFT